MGISNLIKYSIPTPFVVICRADIRDVVGYGNIFAPSRLREEAPLVSQQGNVIILFNSNHVSCIYSSKFMHTLFNTNIYAMF